jgi:hypothetical protein
MQEGKPEGIPGLWLGKFRAAISIAISIAIAMATSSNIDEDYRRRIWL